MSYVVGEYINSFFSFGEIRSEMTSPIGERKKSNEKNTNIFRVSPDKNIFITYALIFHFVDGFMFREL